MKQAQPVCPLTKCERILVAMDRSKYSEKAFDQAISIAKICKSCLFAISVIVMSPEQLGLSYALEEKMLEETKELLERARDRAKKESIPCETIIHVDGHPQNFIIQEAKAKNIDLIVVGTHGRTGLKKLLMSNVAEKVAGHAPCAVLVTPN